MDINIDKIRELADLALEKNLAELKVEDGDKSVTIKTPAGVAATAPSAPVYYQAPAQQAPVGVATPAAKEAPPSEAKSAAPKEAENLYKVTSPMVGTFYSSPSPESPPFVAPGQTVSIGQTLCIIEAMKLMNELESEVSGKVSRVLVENGQPVEFGQTLMLIERN